MSKTSDPIRLLRSEHDAALDQLDRMELAVADLNSAHTQDALERIQRGLEFLEREVRAHGKMEEEVLYPALGRHVPKQTIETLLDEHKDLWCKMDLLANALRSKQPPMNEVRWHAVALIDALRRHIDRENNMVFLMTAQMLSNEEYRDLAEALAEMHKSRERLRS